MMGREVIFICKKNRKGIYAELLDGTFALVHKKHLKEVKPGKKYEGIIIKTIVDRNGNEVPIIANPKPLIIKEIAGAKLVVRWGDETLKQYEPIDAGYTDPLGGRIILVFQTENGLVERCIDYSEKNLKYLKPELRKKVKRMRKETLQKEFEELIEDIQKNGIRVLKEDLEYAIKSNQKDLKELEEEKRKIEQKIADYENALKEIEKEIGKIKVEDNKYTVTMKTQDGKFAKFRRVDYYDTGVYTLETVETDIEDERVIKLLESWYYKQNAIERIKKLDLRQVEEAIKNTKRIIDEFKSQSRV